MAQVYYFDSKTSEWRDIEVEMPYCTLIRLTSGSKLTEEEEHLVKVLIPMKILDEFGRSAADFVPIYKWDSCGDIDLTITNLEPDSDITAYLRLYTQEDCTLSFEPRYKREIHDFEQKILSVNRVTGFFNSYCLSSRNSKREFMVSYEDYTSADEYGNGETKQRTLPTEDEAINFIERNSKINPILS